MSKQPKYIDGLWNRKGSTFKWHNDGGFLATTFHVDRGGHSAHTRKPRGNRGRK